VQIHKGEDVLKEFVDTLPAEAGRTLSDYAKRILSKLPPHSDSDDEPDEKKSTE
jgi:hypothetical protein